MSNFSFLRLIHEPSAHTRNGVSGCPIGAMRTFGRLVHLIGCFPISRSDAMKRPVLAALSIGLLGLACVSNPVQAQGVPDPCKLYLCMASVSGYSTPAQGCEETIAYWHTPTPDGLAVYYYTFQPQPSYELRLHFMQQCKGSQQVQNNSDIFNTIMREWGHEP